MNAPRTSGSDLPLPLPSSRVAITHSNKPPNPSHLNDAFLKPSRSSQSILPPNNLLYSIPNHPSPHSNKLHHQSSPPNPPLATNPPTTFRSIRRNTLIHSALISTCLHLRMQQAGRQARSAYACFKRRGESWKGIVLEVQKTRHQSLWCGLERFVPVMVCGR